YFFVYVYLAALADVRRFHLQRGIPDDISWATLSDLGRNLKRDRLLLGDGGLRTSGWLTLHFRGSIYQLGRLQFNRVNIRAAHVMVIHRIAPRIDYLPQRTTLERAIVAHLRAGMHWRNRTGWVEL